MMAADVHRIQSYLRVAAPRWRDHMPIGPFLATFSRDTDNRYLNYAIPDDGAEPSPADVDASSSVTVDLKAILAAPAR